MHKKTMQLKIACFFTTSSVESRIPSKLTLMTFLQELGHHSNKRQQKYFCLPCITCHVCLWSPPRQFLYKTLNSRTGVLPSAVFFRNITTAKGQSFLHLNISIRLLQRHSPSWKVSSRSAGKEIYNAFFQNVAVNYKAPIFLHSKVPKFCMLYSSFARMPHSPLI